MNRLFLIVWLLAGVPLVAAPALAQTVNQPSPHIFAFPGSSCPGGSHLYKGPEQDEAAASGAVYCVFIRKAQPISKKDSGGKCPDGANLVQQVAADGEFIWCSLPLRRQKQGR